MAAPPSIRLIARCMTASLLLLVSSAHADEHAPLLLGVFQDRDSERRLDNALTGALDVRLRKAGERATLATHLPPRERRCAAQECLDVLAERSGAAHILGADVQRGEEHSRFLTVWLYDVTRKVPLQRSRGCERCDDERVVTVLAELSASVLHDHDAPPDAAAPGRATLARSPRKVTPVSPVGTTASDAAPLVLVGGRASSDTCPRLSRCRLVIAGSLLGLSVASAVTAGLLFHYDQAPSAGPCQSLRSGTTTSACFYDINPYGKAGAAVGAGVLLLGAALTLAIP